MARSVAEREPGRVTPDELMAEACRLALDAVEQGAGGPFGAVVATGDGRIVGRGQNRVLATGDPTAHAEIEAIRDAVRTLAATTAAGQPPPTLVPAGPGAAVPGRARMLAGHVVYASSLPCPMCLAAIAWARIDAIVHAADLDDARAAGFDDAELHAALQHPPEARGIPVRRLRPDLARPALDAWMARPDRRPY